jgi:hemerythrin-like domain-containing protein
MSSAPSLEIVHKDLADEHRRVLELLKLLHKSRPLVDRLPLLEALRNLLIVHFGREQLPGGLYELLGQRAASRAGELDDLVKEHGVILKTLNALLEDARNAAAAGEADVIERMRKLVEQILAHEQKEHRFAKQVLES